MDLVRQDLRYALRAIRKSPGFTAIVVLTLALGIGANAAIFNIVDAVVFQPLPGRDPQQLVRLYSTQEKGGPESGAISYPQFKEYRDNLRSFSAVAAYRTVALEVSTEGEVGQRIPGAIASGTFFDALGIAPLYGRLFSSSDDGARGTNPVAVLSEGFWRRAFDGRPDAVSSMIRINGHSHTIVGVAPGSLQDFERAPQIWLPMSGAIQAEPIMATQIDRMTNDFFKAIARLKPGTSLKQAQLELDILGARLGAGQVIHLWEGMESEQINPSKVTPPAGLKVEQYDWKRPWVAAAPAKKGFSREEGRLSWLLLGVAALVLLIATVDVAVLWLARAQQEEKENAVRAALGASRWALLRQRLVQGLLIAMLSGAVGLLVATWAGNLLLASAPKELPIPVGIASSASGLRVGIFVAVISLFACVGFSLPPSLFRPSRGIMENLKKQSLASSASGSSRTQYALVLVQTIASVVLLADAGLLIKTMRNIGRIDLGFETEHVLSASVDFSRHGYSKTQGAAALAPLLERMRAIPGAAAVALIAGSPVEWRPKALKEQAWACDNLPLRTVSPAYFETLSIPLVRGRDFTAADARDTPGVVIINQAAARTCWPDREAIGWLLPRVGILEKPFEVVGVAGNVRVDEQADISRPQIYAPIAQFYDAYPWQFSISLLVRTELPPRAILPSLEAAVRGLDASLLLYDVQTPRELLGRAYERQAFFMRVLSAFGVLAFVLAIAGLYGLLAYVVSRRVREFGIRVALGAQTHDILRLVMVQGGRLALAGTVIGLGTAIASSQLLRNLLYGVTGTDSVTLAGVAILFFAVALVACYPPARHAAGVDPLVTLRDE